MRGILVVSLITAASSLSAFPASGMHSPVSMAAAFAQPLRAPSIPTFSGLRPARSFPLPDGNRAAAVGRRRLGDQPHGRPLPAGTVPRMALLPVPLVSAQDEWGLLAVVASAAFAGLRLEKTPVGKSLSGAVCAMLITVLLGNIGIVSTGAAGGGGVPYIAAMQGFLVRVATPLLLLGADLGVIFAQTGRMLGAFALGSAGTCLGSTIGYFCFGPWIAQGLGESGWKVASALTAKNIGGGLNFMAVAGQLTIPSDAIAAALTVDNILGLLYFPLVAWLGRDYAETMEGKTADPGASKKSTEVHVEGISVEGLAGAAALGAVFAAFGEAASASYGVPCTIASTFATVAFATAAPALAKPFIASGEALGKLLLFFFFASIGVSSGDIVSALSSSAAPGLMGFGIVLYATHLGLIFAGSNVLKIDRPDTLLASNANIGNPATAAAMAASMGWTSRVLPAILVGTMGNAFGTLLGLTVGANLLSRM